MEEVDRYDCVQLRKFLKDRGITVTGYRRDGLLQLVKTAQQLELPIDPDFTRQDVQEKLSEKLRQIGFPPRDPFTFEGKNDLSNAPRIGVVDILNYLIEKKSDFDQKKAKAYKSFEDYRLFFDGHVLNLRCAEVDKFFVYTAEVKPTQRQTTYLHTSSYKLWIIVSEDGDILLGFCQCPGGADGACRHLSAALYAVEDYQVKSVTDGPATWVRRNTTCEDAEKLSRLPLIQARYGNTDTRRLPSAENYDPRAVADRDHPEDEHDIGNFIETLKQAAPDATVLEFYQEELHGLPDSHSAPDEELLEMTVAKVALNMTIQGDTDLDFGHLMSQLPGTDQEVAKIEEGTRGQSDNPAWFALRRGRITASELHRVCTKQKTAQAKPDTDCSKLALHILGTDSDKPIETPAMEWGKRKETKARKLYCAVEKKNHKKLAVEERGLQVSVKHPFLACSVDGLVKCKCKKADHKDRLVEIKCPFSLRDLSPKEAAKQRRCAQDESGNWMLLEQSDYYYQIQCQLFVCDLQTCDLVIYTSKGILIVPVPFNESFARQTVHLATMFYKQQVLPRLLYEGI